MFWKKFVELCAEKNKSPNEVCRELRFSNATATHWKQGAQPRATSIKKISDYFGVSVEYFSIETDEASLSSDTLDLSKLDPAIVDFLKYVIALPQDEQRSLIQLFKGKKQNDIMGS